MSEHQIRFDDGAAYERMMGTWSRLAGDVFLDWLNPTSWPAVDRCRLRQRCFYCAADRTVRACRDSRDRPVRGATRLRTHSV